MSSSPPPASALATAGRAVLFWRPDSDESFVKPNVDDAAKFLNVLADAVVAAINKGELLAGWFVDWEAVRTA